MVMDKRAREMMKDAPDAPGVYLMKDLRGGLLYVGKAKSLKKRLASYRGTGPGGKTAALCEEAAAVEWRLCKNESMALLLECSLIKKYRPKYNVSLRDDKSFPLVKITAERFPAVFVTRTRDDDAATYFGPYTNAALLRQALKIIRRRFPYRSCRRLPKKACMYYRIGLSPAPCIGKISVRRYRRLISDISLILDGRSDQLIRRLGRQMAQYARQKRYEDAASVRDQIRALSALENPYAGFSSSDEIEDLRALLGLARAPLRIEAFDISTLQGKEATGSMVSFFGGSADKDNYRRFRIKTVAGSDDYAMMAEVVRRRYTRVLREGRGLPDLILIDGGKAHLACVQKVCASLGLRVPLAAIAKEFEHIYLPGEADPLRLEQDTPALNLIRRIRDEAHRFAVTYHRLLRRKKVVGR